MKNLKSLSLFGILILGITSSATAAPYKYATCKGLNIQQPENSTGYILDESCQTAYILPPELGTVRVDSQMSDLTETQCSNVQGSIEILGMNVSRLKTVAAHLAQQTDEAEKLRFELSTRRQNTCEKVEKSAEEFEKSIIDLESVVEQYRIEKNSLTETRDKCAADKKPGCNINDYKIKKLEDAISKGEKYLVSGRAKLAKQKLDFDNCTNRVNRETAALVKQIENYDRIIETLNTQSEDLKTRYDAQLSQETSKPGATIGVTMVTNFASLVEKFKEKNPGLKDKIEFRQMPLKNMQIHFTAIHNGLGAQIPVILRANIPGVSLLKSAAGVDASILAINDIEGQSTTMGASLGGNIVINRLAACNFMKASTNAFKPLKVNVTYDYDVQVKRTVRVASSESNLYKMIKRHTSKNGFFRSSSAVSISEKSTASQWIDVEIISEDSQHAFQDTQKMAQDLREERLNAALLKVATGYLQEGNPAIPATGASGADRASGTLKKCPHVYCQAAGLVLDLGSAFFGGSDASSSMEKVAISKFTSKTTEVVALPQTGTLTFQLEK